MSVFRRFRSLRYGARTKALNQAVVGGLTRKDEHMKRDALKGVSDYLRLRAAASLEDEMHLIVNILKKGLPIPRTSYRERPGCSPGQKKAWCEDKVGSLFRSSAAMVAITQKRYSKTWGVAGVILAQRKRLMNLEGEFPSSCLQTAWRMYAESVPQTPWMQKWLRSYTFRSL